MAEINDPRPLTRSELAEFLPSQRAIRAFEKVFDLIPNDLIALLEAIEGVRKDLEDAVPENEKVINKLSDFYDTPPETSEIILSSGIYRIGALIDLDGHYLSIPAGAVVVFTSGHSSASVISSSVAGALIRGVDSFFFAIDVTLSAPSGRIYDFSQSAGVCVLVERFVVHSNTLLPSLLDNMLISAHFFCQYVSNASGTFSLSGSGFGEFLGQTCNFDSGIVGSAIYLNDAVLGAFDLLSPRFVSTLTNNLVSSSVAANANLGTGKKGRVVDARVVGTDVTMPGIQPDHVRWCILGVQGFENSSIDLFAYTTDLEVISVATSGTFYPVVPTVGSWVSTKQDRWSIAPNGEATFIGEQPAAVSLVSEGSITNSGGAADQVQIRININTGSGFPAVPPEYTTGSTQSQDPTQVKASDLVVIQFGDVVRIEVANISSNRDVEVSPFTRLISTSPPPR